MKGLGVGRLQMRFNAAVATVLTLAGLGGLAGNAKQSAQKGVHVAFHRKALKGKMDGCPAGFHCRHRVSCQHYSGSVVARKDRRGNESW